MSAVANMTERTGSCGDEWHTSARAGQDVCNDLFNDPDDGTLFRCDRALNHPGPCLAGDPLCLTRCPRCGGRERGK